MDASDYDPVECPVEGCAERDAVRAVAAHVANTDDAGHAWDRLEYDGARDFVMTEKRRQRDGQDRTQASGGDAGSTATATSAEGGFQRASEVASTEQSESEASGSDATEADATDDSGQDATDAEIERSGSPTEPDPEPFDLGFEEDALVLLDLVREYEADTLEGLDNEQLVNLYTLLSNLKSAADDARKDVRDALTDRVKSDRAVHGDLGTVQRKTRQRRSLRDEVAVEAAVRQADVDPDDLRSFDKRKVGDVVDDGDLDEDAVFEVSESSYVRKADADDYRRHQRYLRLDDDLRSLVEE